jgi:hypothetical protein
MNNLRMSDQLLWKRWSNKLRRFTKGYSATAPKLRLTTNAETNSMKTILAVIISAVVGSFLFWQVGTAFGNTAGSVVANTTLVLLLLAYSATQPRGLGWGTVVAASVGATVFLGACAMVGGLVYERSQALGNILMAAVSVGYYPPGADVPLVPGFTLWSASSVAVILAGLTSGTAIRRIAGQSSD